MMLVALSCQATMADPRQPVGRIESRALQESSGLVQSVRHPGVFWSHNDSGHRAALFAMTAEGRSIAEIRVDGPAAFDWEDIAIDDQGTLYVGDIGDNDFVRRRYRILEIDEPDPYARPLKVARVSRVWEFRFPNGATNSEALIHHENELYLITKELMRPTIYHLRRLKDGRIEPMVVGRIWLPFVTGADVSADGQFLAVINYSQLAVFDLEKGLHTLAQQEPRRFGFPSLLLAEGCAFDGTDIVITSEHRSVWRFSVGPTQPDVRID